MMKFHFFFSFQGKMKLFEREVSFTINEHDALLAFEAISIEGITEANFLKLVAPICVAVEKFALEGIEKKELFVLFTNKILSEKLHVPVEKIEGMLSMAIDCMEIAVLASKGQLDINKILKSSCFTVFITKISGFCKKAPVKT